MGKGGGATCWFCRQAFRERFPEEVALFIYSCPNCLLRKSLCWDPLDVLETQQGIKLTKLPFLMVLSFS